MHCNEYYNMSFRIVLILMFHLWCSDAKSIKVKVEQGWIEGRVLRPSTGRAEYYSFKGISYAAPPLRKLRFKPPQPPLPWGGTKNASEHRSICVQPSDILAKDILGSEDCLYLNVYSPNLKPGRSLAVMVFIHGGFFTIGSGNDNEYAPDFLMGHDVVLVTLNYRLGVFGFLSVNTTTVPGNAGMLDQIAALQWVQNNIRLFGGDPKCVTIFGQSAGAASVSYHVLSPAAKGLFHRGISMSGNLFNDFAVTFDPKRRAFALGRFLGLDSNNPDELIEFLQNVDYYKLAQVSPNILITDKVLHSLLTTMYFTPIVEQKFGDGSGQYLTEHPSVLMCKGNINKVDFMLGHTHKEGLLGTGRVIDAILNFYPNYTELFVPLKITFNRSPRTVLEAGDRVRNFYFGNKTISLSTIREIVDYYTYSHYVYDMHAYIEKLPKCISTRRYFYQFSLVTPRNVYSRYGAERFGINVSTHKDNLPYLFDGSHYNLTVDVNSEEFKYVDFVCTLFTNFAKYGTPTPDASLGFTWPEYDPGRMYVDIDRSITISSISYGPNTSLGFWQDLYKSLGISL